MKAALLPVLGLLHAASIAAGQAPAPPLAAAESAPAAAEPSRLLQMESIYQRQLRSLHVPHLSRYLTELQRLSAQAPEPAPYQQEIARIQRIVAGGGVVDLSAAAAILQAPADPPSDGMAPPTTAATRPRRGAMALTPGLAATISPPPPAGASSEAAAIGAISWRLESLPAGAHEVIVQYACEKLASPLQLTLDFAGHKLTLTLDAGRGTDSQENFRLLRLGRLMLAEEVRGDTLQLTAGSAGSSILILKQLLLNPVRPSAE